MEKMCLCKRSHGIRKMLTHRLDLHDVCAQYCVLVTKKQANLVALIKEETGQSTVEFVVIFGALLTMVIAFIAFFNAGVDGVFAHLGSVAASHTTGLSVIGMMQDVLLY